MNGAVQDITQAPRALTIRGIDLTPIFSENALAKILQVAQRGLKQPAPLPSYPHTVPQSGPTTGRYEHREALFWTCGFFPGSIYALLERSMLFPSSISIPDPLRAQISDHLLALGRHYSVAINAMSSRTDTHDMGFIVQPALQKDWELTYNKESKKSVVNAAHALASRYDERVGAIRSWDVAINNRYSITDMKENFLVIIDSMCNLDLLYHTAHLTSTPHLATIATTHAHTIRHSILREDASSYHLVNFDPRTGSPKAKMTNQGWADESTWSRGQAWAILGFAQTYTWTKDTVFLATSIRCAELFLARCAEGEGKWGFPRVPRWDFDAPAETGEVLRDASAGVIAANGMVIIYQALQGLSSATVEEVSPGGKNFLDIALEIVGQTLEMCYDNDLAGFAAERGNASVDAEEIHVKESGFDGILRHSTTNWNPDAREPYKDHGLVYADYYLLEFGNKLLRAGLL